MTIDVMNAGSVKQYLTCYIISKALLKSAVQSAIHQKSSLPHGIWMTEVG